MSDDPSSATITSPTPSIERSAQTVAPTRSPSLKAATRALVRSAVAPAGAVEAKLSKASAAKAKNRIRAAEVTVRPVCSSPRVTACSFEPLRSHSSRIRVIRNTS